MLARFLCFLKVLFQFVCISVIWETVREMKQCQEHIVDDLTRPRPRPGEFRMVLGRSSTARRLKDMFRIDIGIRKCRLTSLNIEKRIQLNHLNKRAEHSS